MIEPSISADWVNPTRILIGKGRVRELLPLMAEHRVTAPLLICDPSMVNAPQVKKLLKVLDKSPLSFGVFSDVPAFANQSALTLGIRVFNSGGFDSIIALGRSHVLDLAKLISLYALPNALFHAQAQTTVPKRPASARALVFTLPIGAHRGADISFSAFLDDTGKGGQFIRDKRMRPSGVILDPTLLPNEAKPLIVSTAMDVLAQAVAQWCASEFNPAEKVVALETIRLIFNNLRPALENTAINERIAIMSAAVMGYSGGDTRMGTTTALSHATSLYYKADAGLVAGVLLPYVLAFNKSDIENELTALATQLNIKGGSNGFIKAILKLRQQVDIASKLGDLIKGQKFKKKEKILIEDFATSYPRIQHGNITQKAVLGILDAAILGKMARH